MEQITINSQIGCGDCLKLIKKLPDNSVYLILTDSPYNLGLFMHQRGTNMKGMRDNHFAYSGWDDMAFNQWCKVMKRFIKECSRVLKPKGALVIFMSIMKVETIINLATGNGFYYKTVGIWHKTNPMPRNMNLHFLNSVEPWLYFVNQGHTGTFNNGGKPIHDFIETSTITSSEHRIGKHPTQKPKMLLEHFVKILSNEGDVVLDPFMGSGSTGVVCETNNRKFIGFELNKEYFDIASQRITNRK
mgnify:CR=1 FL=1